MPRRVVWASFVGTALESYDFYVFSYFAVIFVGPLFFDPLGTVGGSLAGLLTIAIAFVIRPIGAIIFGWIGDRIGRRKTLLVTVLLMGIATGLVGLLPDFQTAGWLGAVLLIALRLVQGLALAGEWGGAVLLATEQLDVKRRPFWASFPQLGSPVGSILSGGLFLVMFFTIGIDGMLAWGWRVPFLTAFPLLLVSLYLRWSISETPVFKAIEAAGARVRVPLASVFAKQPVAVVVAIGAAVLGIGSYSLMNSYTLDYGSLVLGYDYMQLLTAVTIGGLLQLVTIPLFGWWATKIGSARVVAIGAIGTLLIAFPIYFLLQFATVPGADRDDAHRRHPPDDVVGGARRAHARPVRLPVRLHRAVLLLRDRGDDQRVRPDRHRTARRRDRQRVVASGHRAGRALGDHPGRSLGGVKDAAA